MVRKMLQIQILTKLIQHPPNPCNTMSDKELLKGFMKEFFPYQEFKKIGFFTAEMKNDYEAQARRICDFFGYETVYEYRAKEIKVHISFAGKRPEGYEDFVTVIPSIYE